MERIYNKEDFKSNQPQTIDDINKIKKEVKLSAIIAIKTAIKDGHAPFLKDQKKDDMQRAYNGATGAAYSNLDSLQMDMKKDKFQYPTNQWISLEQAKKLGVDEKEIDNIRNNFNLEGKKSVTIAYLQKTERLPVIKKDENGNPIPRLDKDGNQLLKKNGEPQYEFETKKDKDGNTILNAKGNPIYEFERQELETPILKKEHMFNVAEFKSLDHSKLKEINKESIYKHINEHSNEANEHRKLIYQDIKKEINEDIGNKITNYLKAQNNMTDYIQNKMSKEQIKEVMENKLDSYQNEVKTITDSNVKKNQPLQEVAKTTKKAENKPKTKESPKKENKVRNGR